MEIVSLHPYREAADGPWSGSSGLGEYDYEHGAAFDDYHSIMIDAIVVGSEVSGGFGCCDSNWYLGMI